MRAHQLWGCVLGNAEPLPVARACLRFDQSFDPFKRFHTGEHTDKNKASLQG